MEETVVKTMQADISHLNLVAPLFDNYRIFYKQQSDMDKAEKFIKERLEKKDSAIFLTLEVKNTLAIGFIQLYPSFTSIGAQRVYILNDLYVDEKYRGKGFGRALVQKAKEFAKENDAAYLILVTAISNLNAQKLYESEGYKRDTEFYTYKLKVI